ncbi:MAG: hypothetical protein ACD_42C00077G0002 [uncultured bacterium]|nr:MAG: hypothetical protein ACD_42C00077G0002 [uncultured bacterium]OGT32899.1 MAG: hypothetical protein A3C44_05010 [Gammaproteobacteria bacterium RIFCSPHIGHO2_02_FULL_39_13]OGT50557.1 MAG: hypothetical protein A3E53_03445 [Gammaproteobacteria bacterium RIFCSPHIGHO2_12_FULL_39_24]
MTIIEILVAAAIFAVALFSLTSFQTNLLRERSLLNQRNYALTLAQNKMQYFRTYTQLTSTTGYFAFDDITDSTAATTTNALGATYSMTWTVTNSSDSTDTPVNRKTIQVVVTWSNPSSTTTNSVAVESLVGRVDPAGSAKVSENLP